MDNHRFDAFAKVLAGSRLTRRKIAAGLGSGFLGAFLGSLRTDAFICRADGTLCASDAQCCSGTCDQASHRCGTAATSGFICRPDGYLCGADAQCCSGTCDPVFHLCACVQGQVACAGQCCAGTQVCAAAACCTPDCTNKTCGDDGCGGSCGSCPTQDPSTCGFTGECVNDACTFYPAGTSCGAAFCTSEHGGLAACTCNGQGEFTRLEFFCSQLICRDGTCQPVCTVGDVCTPATCTGPGSFRAASICVDPGYCGLAVLGICIGYICTNGACLSSCATNDDCQSGYHCESGTNQCCTNDTNQCVA